MLVVGKSIEFHVHIIKLLTFYIEWCTMGHFELGIELYFHRYLLLGKSKYSFLTNFT
jgi:hypothetical protein